MKTLNEVIGTGDLFAEIAKIRTFDFMTGKETSDLTQWFLMCQGERIVYSAVENLSLSQIAQYIVSRKGDIIDNISQYSVKVFENTLSGGETVTKHTNTNNASDTSTQRVVPNNLTEYRDKNQIVDEKTGKSEDITTVSSKIDVSDKMKLFTNDLIYDIFGVMANTICIYIYV